jgi:hypothetical protein
MYLDSLKNISSKLTIYYDGKCPLCLAEIHFLKHHNQKKLLDFVSLQALDSTDHKINCELAFKTIHARLGEKKIITGLTFSLKPIKEQTLRSLTFYSHLDCFDFFMRSFI